MLDSYTSTAASVLTSWWLLKCPWIITTAFSYIKLFRARPLWKETSNWGGYFDYLIIYGVHIPSCLSPMGQTRKLEVLSCEFTSGRCGLRCMASFEQGDWQGSHNSILCRSSLQGEAGSVVFQVTDKYSLHCCLLANQSDVFLENLLPFGNILNTVEWKLFCEMLS